MYFVSLLVTIKGKMGEEEVEDSEWVAVSSQPATEWHGIVERETVI